MKAEAWAAARQSIQIEQRAIGFVLASLDEASLSRAVAAVVAAPRVITCASGSSGIAAMKLAHSLCCIEQPAKFMPPSEAIHGGLGCVQPGDALIMVSRGGKTAELLPFIDVVNTKQAVLIVVTENLASPLGMEADVLLRLKIASESDPLNLMATSSFVATLAVFDALLAALIVETDYSKEQFALIHPGGAVGEKLNKSR